MSQVRILLQLPLEERGIRQSSIRNCQLCIFGGRLASSYKNNKTTIIIAITPATTTANKDH
jgi:hypothetical protein